MKRRMKRLLCIALIAMTVLALLPGEALASKSARINKNTKVYLRASKSSLSVPVSKAKKVTVKGVSNGWAKVSYKKWTGYIPAKYLTLSDPIKVYVKDTYARVYKSPGSGEIDTVSKGTTLYVAGVSGGYARVKNSAGTDRGYVKKSALTTKKPSWKPAPDSYSSTVFPSEYKENIDEDMSDEEIMIEKVIKVARKKMGAPYERGAKGDKKFDCAGFTWYCYKKGTGGKIRLEGRSYEQGYDFGSYDRVNEIDDLERGDLVCFDTDPSDDDESDHVGIYLGGGWFIHASSAAGQVIVSRLDKGYYFANSKGEPVFSWGLRIIE